MRSRLQQSRMLLSRGIISAEEHRNLQQQARSQEAQLAAARQDLDATLARGDAANLRVAELELANAETRLRDLEADLHNAVVRAPVSGVVLLPPEPQGGRPRETIEVGSRVTRGQAMFTVGDLEGFRVQGLVDEVDVNRIRPGQPVRVTGDGFPGLVLTGQVTAVAAQASAAGSGRPGMPTFGVLVEVRGLSPEQRAQLAVGMSANLRIVTYENAEAIVLPPQAVRQEGAERVVRVRDGAGVRRVPVAIGIALPAGIEVRGALRAGDVVLLD